MFLRQCVYYHCCVMLHVCYRALLNLFTSVCVLSCCMFATGRHGAYLCRCVYCHCCVMLYVCYWALHSLFMSLCVLSLFCHAVCLLQGATEPTYVSVCIVIIVLYCMFATARNRVNLYQCVYFHCYVMLYVCYSTQLSLFISMCVSSLLCHAVCLLLGATEPIDVSVCIIIIVLCCMFVTGRYRACLCRCVYRHCCVMLTLKM